MFSFITNMFSKKVEEEEFELEEKTEYRDGDEELLCIPPVESCEYCEEDYAKEIIELEEGLFVEDYTKMDYYKLIYLTILGNLPNKFSTKSRFSNDLREYMTNLPFEMNDINCLPYILQNVDYICKNHRQGCGNPGIKNFIKWKQTSVDDAKMLYDDIVVILQKYKL